MTTCLIKWNWGQLQFMAAPRQLLLDWLATSQHWLLSTGYHRHKCHFLCDIIIQIPYKWLRVSLICSKFYWWFLSALPKKFTHYSYFILISLPIIPILFFCINVSGMCWHLEKQEFEFCCRYIVQILVIQVKWSMKVILAFS